MDALFVVSLAAMGALGLSLIFLIWGPRQRIPDLVVDHVGATAENIQQCRDYAKAKKQKTLQQWRLEKMDWINFTFFEKFKNDNAITEMDHFVFIVKHAGIGEAFPLVWRLVELEAFQSKYEIFEFTPLPTVPRKYTHPMEAEEIECTEYSG